MLTPKQVQEIRERVGTIKSITISCDVLDLLADRAEIAVENAELKKFAAGLELNLAAVIHRAEAAENKRDRLREALVECAVPLEVLHAIDCDLSPATQAGIGKAVTAIRAALFSAHPEPKPEGPKCEKCGGTGWVEDTSGYVDFMMCQVCQMHTGKPYVECTRERKSNDTDQQQSRPEPGGGKRDLSGAATVGASGDTRERGLALG